MKKEDKKTVPLKQAKMPMKPMEKKVAPGKRPTSKKKY